MSESEDPRKSATVLKEPIGRGLVVKQEETHGYVHRLMDMKIIRGDETGFTVKQLNDVFRMPPEEQEWKNAFLDSLIQEGLLNEVRKLSAPEELKRFVFMGEEEQGAWKKELLERKAQSSPQRYITPKYEDTVLVAVRVEPETRDKFHAVMRAKGTNAQEFLSSVIAHEVEKNPALVQRGEHMQAEGTKKNYRTKLQILKEENTRLRKAAQAGTTHRRHR